MAHAENQRNAGEPNIVVRECTTIEDFDACIGLQREAFGLPDLEISPRRHLIVSRQAGGWTLAAFVDDRIVGFVHYMVAVRGAYEIIGYSHMMAVAREFQNKGVGARLKWAQRERALAEDRSFIKWTWDPMQARNAHFNLNRLGVIVRSYAANFYGTDYGMHDSGATHGLDSDRLFAGWNLRSERVVELAQGRTPQISGAPLEAIEIPPDWSAFIKADRAAAQHELLRVRREFENAFAAGLVCAAFERDPAHPRYLLYRQTIDDGR